MPHFINRKRMQKITALMTAFSLYSLHGATQEQMYVANRNTDNVNIIDVATQTITGTVTVGDQPFALALAGTGMYVANQVSDNVNIIDIISQTVAGTVTVGSGPLALALAGTGMYVANISSDNVNIIDTTTQTVAGTVTVGSVPIALAVGGTGMYVANSGDNNVNIIDITTNTVAGTVGVGIAPQALALAGTGMYVANFGSDNVNIIDITTNTVAGTVGVGNQPVALAVGGTGMYVANYADDTVSIIDMGIPNVTNVVSVGNGPSYLALAGTGMYVTNILGNNINIIDINTYAVSGTVTGFHAPIALALASPPPPLISTSGLHGNARKTANYLNGTADSSLLIEFYGLSFDQTVDALNAVCPSRNHASFLSSEFVLQTASRSLTNHLRQSQNFFAFEPKTNPKATAFVVAAKDKIPCKAEEKQNTINVWGLNTAEYAHLKQSPDNNPSLGFFSDTTLLGVDYQTHDRMLVGGLLGYSHIHNHQGDNAGHASSNLYMASLYADLFWNHFYFSPGVLGAFDTTEQMRRIKFTDFDSKAHSDLFAWYVDPHVELGYEVVCKDVVIVPFSLLDWTFGWQRDYHETGASPFNENAPSQAGSLLRSETGLRLFQHLCYGWGDVFFTEKASYVFEKPFSAGNIQTGFVGAPGNFSVAYANHNLNLGAVGFDTVFSFGKKNPTQFRLGVEGEAGSNYWSCEGTAELTHKF